MAKILIVGPTIWSIWHFRGALLGSLVELGHEVIACAPHEVREELDAVTASGVRYIPLQIERASLSIYSNLNSCYQLFKILREERPKAVLAYTVKPIIFAGAATFLTRTQCYFAMVTGLGHSLRATSFLHKLLTFLVKLLYRIALKKVTKIFFQNIDDRNYFEAHNIISRKHEAILVNGSGVNLTYFSSCPLPDKPVFAILTRLLVSKGVCG